MREMVTLTHIRPLSSSDVGSELTQIQITPNMSTLTKRLKFPGSHHLPQHSHHQRTHPGNPHLSVASHLVQLSDNLNFARAWVELSLQAQARETGAVLESTAMLTPRSKKLPACTISKLGILLETRSIWPVARSRSSESGARARLKGRAMLQELSSKGESHFQRLGTIDGQARPQD